MPGYKACDVMRNEAYVLYAAVTHGEHNAVDGPVLRSRAATEDGRFSTARPHLYRRAPPDTSMVWPVIKSDSSDARNRMQLATSAGLATRPSG